MKREREKFFSFHYFENQGQRGPRVCLCADVRVQGQQRWGVYIYREIKKKNSTEDESDSYGESVAVDIVRPVRKFNFSHFFPHLFFDILSLSFSI